MRYIILLLLLCPFASATDGKVSIKYDVNELFGACSTEELNNLNGWTWAECIGNFFNPSMPNPMDIFKSISEEQIKYKYDYIFSFSGIIDTLLTPLKFIWAVIGFVFEFIADILIFMIKFVVRFVFTYLFYVSIGFQTLLGYLNKDTKLSNVDRIYTTLIIMLGASILTLGGNIWS